MGLFDIRDLLLLVPRPLERVGEELGIAQACTRAGQSVAVRGVVRSLRFSRQGWRRSLLRLSIEDETGRIDAPSRIS